MTEREPFASYRYLKNADETIEIYLTRSGLVVHRVEQGYADMSFGAALAVVKGLNEDHNAGVEEEVLKALDLERSNTKDQWAIYEAAAKGCPLCGLLWPDHKDTCGLWVRRSRREGK